MKFLLFTGLCILILTVSLPALILSPDEKNSESTTVTTETQETEPTFHETSDEKDLSTDDKTYIATEATEYLYETDNDSLKRAVLTICKNNYIYRNENNITHNKLKISSFSETLYNELFAMLSKNMSNITYDKETVYIPIMKNGPINTIESAEYPYIKSVASPWEMQDINFNRFADYSCAISVSGMRYLSEKGLSAEEIMTWYLPMLSK